MISSNIQTVVLSNALGVDLGTQTVSIPAGFDRLVFSVPLGDVFMAFFESDLDNAYRRFRISSTATNLIIPNPKGLGTLYFAVDDAIAVTPDTVLSVMVL